MSEITDLETLPRHRNWIENEWRSLKQVVQLDIGVQIISWRQVKLTFQKQILHNKHPGFPSDIEATVVFPPVTVCCFYTYAEALVVIEPIQPPPNTTITQPLYSLRI